MNKLKITRAVSVSLLIGLIGCMFACEKRNPDKSIDHECNNDSSKCSKNVSNIKTESPKRPESSIFIMDISVSMKGYFGSGDSRLLGVVRSYLNIATSEPVIHWYGKSETEGITRKDFLNITQNSIDWSHESDIKSMLQSMVEHSNDYDICLLLTDGILSGSNEQIRKSYRGKYNIEKKEWMSEEIKTIFDRNDSLSAIVIRYIAGFNGTYSCYNNESKFLTNKERPYYIIAVGKWKYVKYIEEQLKSEGGDVLDKPYDFYVMFGDEQTYKNAKFSYNSGIKGIHDDCMIIERNVKTEGDVVLSANIKDLPYYMHDVEYWNKNLKLSVHQDNHSERALTHDDYDVYLDTVSAKQIVCKLSIKARNLVGRSLVLKLEYESPSWIKEYNDDDDLDILSNSKEMLRTFNLKYLIDGFKGLQNEKYVICQIIKFK